MKKLQDSVVLKTICYIIMPLLFLNIIINTFSIIYYDEYKEDIESGITYFQTERFAENYFRKIYSEINNISIIREDEDEQTDIMLIDANDSLEKDKIAKETMTYEPENDIEYENTSRRTKRLYKSKKILLEL